MQKALLEYTETLATFASVTNSAWIETTQLTALSIQAVVDVNTPSAKVFTADAVTDIFTSAAHGFVTGLKVQVSNSGGALPAGLSAATDYFVIRLTADTFQLATSLADALAGTPQLITTNGTGTQTATPTAIAGGSIKLQETNDTTLTPSDVASSSQNITADATLMLTYTPSRAKFVRTQTNLTAGSMSQTQRIFGVGLDG
jgi:hypothetical protein